MASKLKIEKRIGEELAGIRRVAEKLPTREAHALINHCNKIAGYGRKAQAIADSYLDAPTRANYDAQTQDDIATLANRQQAVFLALASGRRLDLRNAKEFKISQMTTTIVKIRKRLDHDPDAEYIVCDRWVRPDETRRPFKQYWFEKKPQLRKEGEL